MNSNPRQRLAAGCWSLFGILPGSAQFVGEIMSQAFEGKKIACKLEFCSGLQAIKIHYSPM
jgi:hypothetical protein